MCVYFPVFPTNGHIISHVFSPNLVLFYSFFTVLDALVAMEPTSLVVQYDRAKDDVLENIETFEDMGPGWVVNSVKKLELHTVKYMPL